MRAAPLACALLLVGCASGAGTAARDGLGAPAAASNSDILYADEIASAHATDAYDAIMRLRPRFLAPHALVSARRPEGVQVVVDGVTVRGRDDLRNVSAASIVYIRYLSALEASTNWGGGFTTPVVYVLTRAGPAPR